MIRREELQSELNSLLKCDLYDDFTVNGLQVEGKDEIQRLVTGVSPSLKLFETAVKEKADAIILHHGIFWKRSTPNPLVLTGNLRARIATLIKKDINLFAYHLPLDGDALFGNNALICRNLGLEDIEIVPESGSNFPLVAVGNLSNSFSFKNFIKMADEAIETEGLGIDLTGRPVKRVAVVTGAGSDCWSDAVRLGADILITGEIRESDVREAEEAGISLYAGGHYNTEKWGVRALGYYLGERYGLEVSFIDVPNPI